MQYSLVNGNKTEAFHGGKGICPNCNFPTIAKCGSRVIHHWAHSARKECDPWWENETEWHRSWKSFFPIECREVSHIAEDGEVHRADVKTKTGIIIELQHSSICDEERISREMFYKNLVWIIDGKPFSRNFDVYHMLPDPESEIASQITWEKAHRHLNGCNSGMFYYKTDLEKTENKYYPMVQIHFYDEIKDKIEKSYKGHHQYDWIRPRKEWFESKCPVYIDFGYDLLYRLCFYSNSNLRCIHIISKLKFLHDVTVETNVENIGKRFYPIKKIN